MTDNAKLVGWKGIAAHFRRDERTVMRWAATKGMPVERVAGQGRGSVYGSPDALDAWLGSSLAKTPKLDEVEFELEGQNESVELPIPAARPRHRAWIGIAMIAGVVAFLTIVALAVLGPAGASPPRSTYTDPVAKAAYLKGTYDWNARTPDSLLSATREYSEAIGLDPRVAASYTGLANSYLLLREYGSLPDDQAYSRAEAAANAAIALDPLSPEAHRALAFIAFWWHRDRTSARSEFARALQLKPDDPLTHHWFATALSANGESSAALHEIETARDLDPTSISIVTDVGLLTYLSGDRGTGSALLRSQERDRPEDVGTHRSLADIALSEGRGSEYLAEAMVTAKLRTDNVVENEVNLLEIEAHGSNIRRLLTVMLNEARRKVARTGSGHYELALVASLSDSRTEALAELGKACDTHEATTIGASGSLWLSHALSKAQITRRCGFISLLG